MPAKQERLGATNSFFERVGLIGGFPAALVAGLVQQRA